MASVRIVQEGGDLARRALRASRRAGRQTAGRAHQPLDEIEVEGHQLGRGIAVVRLVIGRIRVEIGPQPPGGDAQQASVLARSRDRFDVLIGAERAHEQADLQQAVGAPGGVAHLPGFVQLERQRSLAEHMLAGLQRRNDEGVVGGARQANVDCVRRGNQGVGVGERLGLAEGSSGAGACRVAREHADDGRFCDPGIGRRMGRSHGAGAQNADPDRGQSSQPAALTCSRKVLLTGTRSPIAQHQHRTAAIALDRRDRALGDPPRAMHLAPARRSELGQRIAQAQQDEIAAQRGVDAEVMVLHLQRQQVAAQRRRHAAEEVGYGRGLAHPLPARTRRAPARYRPRHAGAAR